MRDLPEAARRRIRSRIRGLQQSPYQGVVKLATAPGFRLRVGDYRILFQVDDDERTVRVTGIRHRREAYR